jgi:hypothetical protein
VLLEDQQNVGCKFFRNAALKAEHVVMFVEAQVMRNLFGHNRDNMKLQDGDSY